MTFVKVYKHCAKDVCFCPLSYILPTILLRALRGPTTLIQACSE